MVAPTFLTLPEASKRLSERTGEPVTPGWLLQHACDGRLRLHFLLRRMVIVERHGSPEFIRECHAGTFHQLNQNDARWILAQEGDEWSYTIRTLPDESGRPGWVQDVVTTKREPVEITLRDLRIERSQLDELLGNEQAVVTAKSKRLTQRQRVEHWLMECERRAIDLGEPFDRRSMPGQKADFLKLLHTLDKALQTINTVESLENYTDNLCSWPNNAGHQPVATPFFRRLFPEHFKSHGVSEAQRRGV